MKEVPAAGGRCLVVRKKRLTGARHALASFIKACHLGVYFAPIDVLNKRDRAILDSPHGNELLHSVPGGCVPLDDEDMRYLARAYAVASPEAFLCHLRLKYRLEDVLSSDYQLLTARAKRRHTRRKHIPVRVVLQVLRRDSFRCKACGSSDDLTVDHIVPWIQGGADDASNLQTLCGKCNRRKGAKL